MESKNFFAGKDNSETLTALHLLSDHYRKELDSFNFKINPNIRSIKTIVKETAVGIKQEEIDMAKRLHVDEKAMKKLLDERKSLENLE